MRKELIIKDKNISEEDVTNSLHIISKIDVLCIPSTFLKIFSNLSNIVNLAALIDYPNGLSDTRIRIHETIYAARTGVKYVDIVVNNSLISSDKIGDIIEDMNTCCRAAKDSNVEVRAILEYTLFPIDQILELSMALSTNTCISAIITSTGAMPQEPHDDIIICNKLLKNTFVDVISCSCWTKKYIDLLKSINISGIRFLSTQSLNNMVKV